MESEARHHQVWLVSDGYGASIAVSEVSIDDGVKQEIEQHGLVRLAELSVALAAAEDSALLHCSPESFQINGTTFWSFESTTAERDTMRVVLFSTGVKVLEVRAIKRAGAAFPAARAVFETQQGFLETLRW